MDDVEQRVDAVLRKRYGKKKKSNTLNYVLLFIVMASLGGVVALPLFDDKSLLSHAQTYLESKTNNNPLVATQSTNVSPFNYVNGFVGFGTPIVIKEINWTFIEDRFNYSVESKGVNYTDSLFVNWSYYGQFKKISYEWFATVKGYYYFNITFDTDANSLEYLDGNLTCNYSDGGLFFDINDIIGLPVDVDYEIVDDVFYLYIGANVKNKNTQVSLDPYFGTNSILGSGGSSIANQIKGTLATPSSNGTADSITLYTTSGWSDGEKIQCALVERTGVNTYVFVNATEEKDHGGSGWFVFNFTAPKPSVNTLKEYGIAFHSDSTWVYAYVSPGSGMRDGAATYIDWSLTGAVDYSYTYSVYCNYTVSAPSGKTWQSNYSGYLTGGNNTDFVQNYSGWLTGGNATVTWKQNYTGWLTGGNETDFVQNYSGWLTGGNNTDWIQNYSGWLSGGNATVTWQSNYSGWLTGGNISANVSWQSNYTGWLTGGNNTDWVQNYTGWLSGGNVSKVWQSNYSGWLTGGNTTPLPFTITNEFPTNLSNIYSPQPTLFFTLTHSGGTNMNYTVSIGNSTLNCTYVLVSNSNVTNGTYHYVNYYNATEFYTDYYFSVDATDGVTWVNETYSFQAVLQGGGQSTNTGSIMALAVGSIGIAVLAFMYAIRKKKRR